MIIMFIQKSFQEFNNFDWKITRFLLLRVYPREQMRLRWTDIGISSRIFVKPFIKISLSAADGAKKCGRRRALNHQLSVR